MPALILAGRAGVADIHSGRAFPRRLGLQSQRLRIILPHGPMPDCIDLDQLGLFVYPIDDAVNVWLIPKEQMPELGILRYRWVTVRRLFQAKKLLLKPGTPTERRIGFRRVDEVIAMRQISLRSRQEFNQVCHVSLQTRLKTPLAAVLSHL